MILRKLSQSFKITLALMLSVLSSGILQVAPAYATDNGSLQQVFCNLLGESGKWRAQIGGPSTEHEYPLTGVLVHDQKDVTPAMDAECASLYGTVSITIEPSAKDPTCETDGELTLPAIKHITWTGGEAGDGPGVYNLTAVADKGYTISGKYQWTVEVLPQLAGERCEETTIKYVTPEVISTHQTAVCVEGKKKITSGSIAVTATEGLHYWLDNNEITDSKNVKPGTYQIILTTDEGYELAEGKTSPISVTINPAEALKCNQPPADLCRNVDGTQSTLPEYVEVQGNGNCVVTICHRTNAAKNPYRMITVSVRAVDGESGNSGNRADHFDEHDDGPVFDPATMTNGGDWGDIIPPVEPYHEGLNWTEGQAVWENDCKMPKGVTTAEPRFRDFCGESHDFFRIPSREGVQYSVNGEPTAPGVYNPGTTVIAITAEAMEGYVLREGSETEWTFSYTDENCLSITKAANPINDTNGDGRIGVGDRATWTVTVTNTGDRTVEAFDVQVFDEGATIEGDSYIERLEPGESFVVNAYTVITASHIGQICKVTNSASFGANYTQNDVDRLFEVQLPVEEDYEFTGTANAEATFTCPTTPGRVLGEQAPPTPGKTLSASTVLPAMLPATGAKDSPYMILVAALIAYGATYFIQGRRKLLRNEA